MSRGRGGRLVSRPYRGPTPNHTEILSVLAKDLRPLLVMAVVQERTVLGSSVALRWGSFRDSTWDAGAQPCAPTESPRTVVVSG